MKKKDVRLKGQLKMYMRWPLIMTVLLIAMNFWMYRIDRQAAGMMSVFVIIYAAVVGILYFHNRSLILADMIQFSTQYKGIQNTLLRELAIPYAILMEDGRIVWKNDRFEEEFCGRRREMRRTRSWRSSITGGITRSISARFPWKASARPRTCCTSPGRKNFLSSSI